MRSRKLWALAIALLGGLVFGLPSQARASYSVQIYDDGKLVTKGITVIQAGDILTFFGSTPHFSLTTGSGASNNPGSQGGTSLALSNNETITSTFGTTGGTHSLKIVLSQTDFIAPVGNPIILTSSGGGSTGLVGTNPGGKSSVTSTYQGFLDTSNTLFGQPAAGATPLQTGTSPLSLPTNPIVYSPPIAINPAVKGGTPFSMTDVLTFTFALQKGSGRDSANASFTTTATTLSTPAPAGLVLALTGLPCLGIGQWVRRRRSKRA